LAAVTDSLLPATARQLLGRTAQAQADSRVPSLVAGVVRGGELVWSAGRGDVGGAEPDADVQYRLGSITKSVTAVLVMRLRDEGRLGLDDPLDRHLPGTPFGDRTVGQLLSHVAGVTAESPGVWWERTPGLSWDELGSQLAAEHLVHSAGRRFHYSNLGYGVLGELVARLRGVSWWDAARGEVLEPLGMTRTSTRPSGRAASGFAVHPWADMVLAEPEHDAVAMAPAGQLWATLADLGRWAAFLLGDGGPVLRDGTLEEMIIPAGIDHSAPEWSSYGLGLQVLRVGGRTLVGHGGSMPGFLAAVFADRSAGLGSVALVNATSGLDPSLLTALLDIVQSAEPPVPRPWRPAERLDADALELIGPWYWGTSVVGMRLDAAGVLHLAPLATGRRASRFVRRGGAWLGLDGYYAGETMQVRRGDDGRVVALDVATLTFTRTPYADDAPVPGGVDSAGWQPAGTEHAPDQRRPRATAQPPS
jgi:CubicO group peptidase (beta-lactamase class C family)